MLKLTNSILEQDVYYYGESEVLRGNTDEASTLPNSEREPSGQLHFQKLFDFSNEGKGLLLHLCKPPPPAPPHVHMDG